MTQPNVLPIASIPCGADTTAHRTATPRNVSGSRLLATHRAARLQSGLPDVASGSLNDVAKSGVSDDGAQSGSPPGVQSAQPAAGLQPFSSSGRESECDAEVDNRADFS